MNQQVNNLIMNADENRTVEHTSELQSTSNLVFRRLLY